MKAFKRALRTYLQSTIGIFLGLWATSGISADHFAGVSDLTVLAKLGVGALIGAVPALLAYVQNLLEDEGVVPTVLKDPATPAARRRTLGDAGSADLASLGFALIVLGVLAWLLLSGGLGLLLIVVGVVLLVVPALRRR